MTLGLRVVAAEGEGRTALGLQQQVEVAVVLQAVGRKSNVEEVIARAEEQPRKAHLEGLSAAPQVQHLGMWVSVLVKLIAVRRGDRQRSRVLVDLDTDIYI